LKFFQLGLGLGLGFGVNVGVGIVVRGRGVGFWILQNISQMEVFAEENNVTSSMLSSTQPPQLQHHPFTNFTIISVNIDFNLSQYFFLP
jgi:hypothetical protein